MAKVKALYVVQCRDFVLARYGEAGIEAVKAAMEPAAREAVYSPLLLPSDWIEVSYALEHALGYDRAFAKAVPLQAAEHMLSQLVAEHYNRMYRPVFVGATTPLDLLDRSGRLWRRFYDCGEVELVVHGSTSATKRIRGCDFPERHELLMVPYYEEMLRQWGARDVTARHLKCVARGAEYCETQISWKASSSRPK